MKKKFEVICERKLIEDDLSTKRIVVCLGKPAKYQDSEFVCAFQLVGLDSSQIQYARGEDSFQAFLLAFEGIRVALNKSGKTFTWIGDEKGDHGFPRLVPASFGVAFSNRLNNIIDQELEKFFEGINKEIKVK